MIGWASAAQKRMCYFVCYALILLPRLQTGMHSTARYQKLDIIPVTWLLNGAAQLPELDRGCNCLRLNLT